MSSSVDGGESMKSLWLRVRGRSRGCFGKMGPRKNHPYRLLETPASRASARKMALTPGYPPLIYRQFSANHPGMPLFKKVSVDKTMRRFVCTV